MSSVGRVCNEGHRDAERHAQALAMADMLSSGTIAQFPPKFRP